LKKDESFEEYINPEVLEASDLVDFENEVCLSIPGAFATTKRFKRLKLRWEDQNGIKKEGEFLDLQAFAVQHEMDHLDGKLYVDQFGPLKRQMVVAKHKKFLRLFRRR
jgi:peptide deformylase